MSTSNFQTTNNLPSEYDLPSFDTLPPSPLQNQPSPQPTNSTETQEFQSSFKPKESSVPASDFYYNPTANNDVKTSTFTCSAVGNQTAFPYLITKANYGQDHVYLYDFDSKRIVLTYSGDLSLDVDGIPMKKSTMPFDTPHGSKTGYVFYKTTKKYLDVLDNLFNSEWRAEDKLKVPLPPVMEERDPSLLWSGLLGTIKSELFEYSDKSVALMTDPPSQKEDFAVLNGIFNYSLKHPTRGKVAGHIVSKKKLGPLQNIIPVDFGSKFTKSAPVILRPSNKFSPILLVEENQMSGTQVFKLRQYRYSEASYALTFDPPADISNNLVQLNHGLTINGQKQSGFIFALANKQAIEYLKAVFPKAKLDDEMPGAAMTSNIGAPAAVPVAPKMEQRISDLAISLMTKLSGVKELVTEEAHNKIIYYGPVEQLESIDVDEEDLLLNLTAGDNQLVISKKN